MDGALKKLRIEAFASPDYSGSPKGSFDVMFNPSTYAVKYAVEYEEDQGKGTSGLPQKYKQTKPLDFSLDFTLDGTGASAESKEVIEEVRHFLSVVHTYDGEIHRPPYLKVAWGSLLFNCVFKGANVKYTLFKPNGEPLRANISASFVGSVDDTKRAAEERASSPDLARYHVVTEYDTLPLLAHRHYGDMRHYLEVARINALDDFRNLTVGQRLLFPPVDKAAVRAR